MRSGLCRFVVGPVRLERRSEPSVAMSIASPMLAAAAMLRTGFSLCSAVGKSPLALEDLKVIELMVFWSLG